MRFRDRLTQAVINLCYIEPYVFPHRFLFLVLSPRRTRGERLSNPTQSKPSVPQARRFFYFHFIF